mgnify:FL=1
MIPAIKVISDITIRVLRFRVRECSVFKTATKFIGFLFPHHTIGGCTDAGCGGPSSPCDSGGSCVDTVTYPPSDCGSQGCSDCGDGGCVNDPNSVGNFPVEAGSGLCMNGGTAVQNGFCACDKGFYGSQCEHGKYREP